MNKKLNDKYINLMQSAVDCGDTETGHGDADDLLCDLLRELGYNELVDKYNDVAKWYS